MFHSHVWVNILCSRPTGSTQRVQVLRLDQVKSENPDHIGGYALTVPILSGIETKFGLVFPKFKNERIESLV
jgi:solute carrier family 25 aspartate/glutamate transporter 12/13